MIIQISLPKIIHIRKLQKYDFVVTGECVRSMEWSFNLTKNLRIYHKFKENGSAEYNWLNMFLKRYPNLNSKIRRHFFVLGIWIHSYFQLLKLILQKNPLKQTKKFI